MTRIFFIPQYFFGIITFLLKIFINFFLKILYYNFLKAKSCKLCFDNNANKLVFLKNYFLSYF